MYFVMQGRDVANLHLKASAAGLFSLHFRLLSIFFIPRDVGSSFFERCTAGNELAWVSKGGTVHEAKQSKFTIKFNYNDKMLMNHSPEKENRSPEGKRRDKPSKELKSPQELLQALAFHSISISPQLSNHILQYPSQHSHQQINLFAPHEEENVQQLRVRLADYEFQLKKMGEDFAEFQLLAKMERDRHVKRLKEELEFERHRNIEDNSKWEKKFAERHQQYEEECRAYRSRVEEESKKNIEEALAKAQITHHNAITALKMTHQETVNNLQRSIERLKLDFEKQVKQEKEEHQKDIQTLKQKHETVLKQKEQQFETRIVAVQCQKKAEMQATQETRKESTKIQEKYLHQIGIIERQKRTLEDKAEEMEIRAKVLTKRLEDRNKEIEQLKQAHTQELQKAESDRQNAMQQARNTIDHEKIQFLRDEYARTEQIQLKLMRLNEVKEHTENAYESLLRTMETRFERRQSKREDIQALREYEEQLLLRKRENSQIYQQLRMVQLEKENNDKIYTRIFTSSKKEKKSLSHKNGQELQALFKQSNTTDFRHLLKMAQK